MSRHLVLGRPLGQSPVGEECSLKDLLRQSFPAHSGHRVELTYLGSLDTEKWLDIPRFTDFRPVLFVMKCHTENYPQKSHLCPLFFWQYSFSRHLRFMTTGEDRKKDRFKNLKLKSLKVPVSQPRSNKAHAELRLLYQSVYQSLCSDFRHSWIPP